MRDKSAASAGLSDAMDKCNLPEKYRCGELQGNSKRWSGAAGDFPAACGFGNEQFRHTGQYYGG